MQRKPKLLKDVNMDIRTMPWPYPSISRESLVSGLKPKYALSGSEMARLALPIFGGTSPTETTTTTTETKPEEKTGDPGSGGDTTETKPMTPEEVSKLLDSVSTLTTKVDQLTVENNSFKNEKQKQERAAMGREEALTADLEDAQQTIIKMDQALRNQAIVNAINSYKDIQFHETEFVVGMIDPAIRENMTVDLENGTVTVNGIENELKRIAKEKSWAVKQVSSPGNGNPTGNGTGTPTPPRSSGTPPANPGSSGDKAARRKSLAEKWPVIAAGRRV